MSAVGGSIESISIRGRIFPVAADADVSTKPGGFEKELQPNGNGTVRTVMSRVPWMIEGLTVEIDEDRADLEFLQEIANQKAHVTIALTYASGHTRQGSGTITGEVKSSSQNATAEVTLGGGGELTLQ